MAYMENGLRHVQLVHQKSNELLDMSSTLESYRNTLHELLELCKYEAFTLRPVRQDHGGSVRGVRSVLNIPQMIVKEFLTRDEIRAAQATKTTLDVIRSLHVYITEETLREYFHPEVYSDLTDRDALYRVIALKEAALKSRAICQERVMATIEKILENHLYEDVGGLVLQFFKRKEAESLANWTALLAQQKNREVIVGWLSNS